jgi:hypothetical protein
MLDKKYILPPNQRLRDIEAYLKTDGVNKIIEEMNVYSNYSPSTKSSSPEN